MEDWEDCHNIPTVDHDTLQQPVQGGKLQSSYARWSTPHFDGNGGIGVWNKESNMSEKDQYHLCNYAIRLQFGFKNCNRMQLVFYNNKLNYITFLIMLEWNF